MCDYDEYLYACKYGRIINRKYVFNEDRDPVMDYIDEYWNDVKELEDINVNSVYTKGDLSYM